MLHLWKLDTKKTKQMEQSGLSDKSQDSDRFTQKTSARKAKILQTPPFGRQTRSIFQPSLLVFWLTGQGHVLANL
jgi:hypothetical protein